MSFIDLMANDVWSEADITHRTEAMLHGQVSKEQELILSRKMIGFSLGLVIPTAEEQVELTTYQLAAEAAQQAGVEARADMALLQEVLDYEAAQARLALPAIIDPVMITEGEEEIPNPGVAADMAERAEAQSVIGTVSNNAKSLALLRNPPPEVENVTA